MSRGARRGIGSRLAAAFGLMVGLLLLVAAIGLARLDSLSGEFTTIVVDRHSRTEILRDVTDAQHVTMRLVNHLLVFDDRQRVEADLAAIQAAQRRVGELLERLDHASGGDDERGKALLREAHERTAAYLVNLVRFQRLAAAGKRDEARAVLEGGLERQLDAAYEAMTNLSRSQTALMHRAQQDALDSYQQARLQIILVALLSIAASIGVAVAIARGITRPLGHAVTVADAVAGGDLTSRIVARGGDETARLMEGLGRMNESLARIVVEVRTGSAGIAGTAREMVHGNAQLTQRAEEQASSLEETAATLEELTETVRSNADHAGEASRLAIAATEVAVRGGEAVARAVARMDSITGAARRIAETTGMINSIASQTNLLALNAAVEAARAGEEGRGFAVVAAEVRGLSHRSAAAAREIGELIAATVHEVEDGARLVKDAGQTMEEVVSGIRRATALIGDISSASREQSDAIAQVNQALSQIDEVTQSNVALAEQSAAAVESLEGRARALVESVSVFRLAEAPATAALPAAAIPTKKRAARGGPLRLDPRLLPPQRHPG